VSLPWPGFATFVPGELPALDPREAALPGRIDLWAFALDTPAPTEAWLARLSRAECDRAARFVRDRDRHRFAVGRAVLRAVLARYLAIAPDAVAIETEGHGKPRLGPAHAGAGIEFNLAHSHGGALVGVGRGRRLGVDLELATDTLETEALARRFFTSRECAVIAAGRPGERARFYRHWVAKEAVLKAHGGGLSIPLHDVEIVFAGDDRAGVRSRDPQAPGAHWTLRLLEGPGGWHAAVASSGAAWDAKFMTRGDPPATAVPRG
jgi:4'-phosphopantetheinyl transferase